MREDARGIDFTGHLPLICFYFMTVVHVQVISYVLDLCMNLLKSGFI